MINAENVDEKLAKQKGLPDEIITEILENKDEDYAYKILYQAAVIYYHLIGKNSYPEEKDLLRAFPFTKKWLDPAVICTQLLQKYELEKNIW